MKKEKIITDTTIEGDLLFDGNIIFENNCFVEGSIYAGGWIKSGDWIESGGSIKSGGSIESGGWIKSGDWIESGGSIESGGWIFSFTFDIFAKSIKTATLPFGRQFWAGMHPLKKWEKEILETLNCWNDYKALISKEEAQKICEWEGWHWIIRAQLEMFFGLKESYVIEEVNYEQ